MLRQVVLFHNNEIIFSHHFAQAYSTETLNIVLRKKLSAYIDQPSDGETFNKPLFDFQSHFGIFNDVFFVYVTDMSDRPKVIGKEIQRAAAMFVKYFSNPLDIKNSSQQKDEFVKFINETHYLLHPKISLMGPSPFERQTIMNLLKISPDPENRIMNFAIFNQIQIGTLFLDLWDFTEQDIFSPLWNNYIRGSDMILFIIDGSSAALDESQLKFFNNLRQREGKFSKAAIFLSNAKYDDFITKEGLMTTYPFLERYEIFELDLGAADGKTQLITAMSKAIGLKQALPLEFKIKLQKANNHVSKQEYAEAIDLLVQLVKICEDYQEFNYIDIFNKKIDELRVKLKEKQLQDEIFQKKIRAPKTISFGKFEGAKKLPGDGNLPPILPKIKHVDDALQKVIDASKMDDLGGEKTHSKALPGLSSPPTPTPPQSKPISLDSPLPPLILKKNSVDKPLPSANPFMTGMPTLDLDAAFGINDEIESSKRENTSPIMDEEFDTDKNSTDIDALLREHEKINDLSTDLDFFEEIQAEHEESKLKMDSMPIGIKTTTNPSTTDGREMEEPPAAIPNIESGAPMETFQIRNYSVDPIEIFSPNQPTVHEKSIKSPDPLLTPLTQQKMGVTRRKTLTFEKSPLIEQIERKSHVDIRKTKSHSSVAEDNPLQNFTQETSPLNPQIIMTPAEKLEQAILIRGDTLALELCEKFVSQLRLKLKRTLNDGDIDNVAEMYIKQKQKRKQSS